MTKAELLKELAEVPDNAQIFIHVQYADDIDTLVDEVHVSVIPAEYHEDGLVEDEFVVIRQKRDLCK